jgi:hypothetical protein
LILIGLSLGTLLFKVLVNFGYVTAVDEEDRDRRACEYKLRSFYAQHVSLSSGRCKNVFFVTVSAG